MRLSFDVNAVFDADWNPKVGMVERINALAEAGHTIVIVMNGIMSNYHPLRTACDKHGLVTHGWEGHHRQSDMYFSDKCINTQDMRYRLDILLNGEPNGCI